MDNYFYYSEWLLRIRCTCVAAGPEKASDKLTSVYVKRWHPSKYELGPFEEVILRDNTLTELKSQVQVVWLFCVNYISCHA